MANQFPETELDITGEPTKPFDFAAARAARGQQSLDGASLQELMDLRTQIESRLPARTLGEINVEAELILQYTVARQLQVEVMAQDEVPANQKAQVMNTCAATLDKIQDTQSKFYSQERFKRIEALLISALKKWPVEQAALFIDEYEKMLEGT